MASSRRPFAHRSLWIVLGLLPVALTGCVKEVSQGSETTFTYELWVSLTTFLGGVAAVPAGWALRKRVARLGWALLIAGPIAALGFAPSLYSDQVVVNEQMFRIHTGFWGAANVQEVRFADLQSVQLTEETRQTRRGKRSTTYLLCNMKSGGQKKIALSGSLAESAAAPIAAGIARHGVPLIE